MPDGASQVKLNNVSITEKQALTNAVLRTVTTNITVDVQSSGTSKVAVLDFATLNTNEFLPSSINVAFTETAAVPDAGTGVEILAWYVTYSASNKWAAGTAYNTKQATVANRAGAEITFTVDLPTGYQNATYKAGDTNNVTMPAFTNVTTRTAYKAALPSASTTKPVVAIDVDSTKLNIQEDSVVTTEDRSDYVSAYAKAGVTTTVTGDTTTIGGFSQSSLNSLLESEVSKALLKVMQGTNMPGYLWVGVKYQSPKVNGNYANSVVMRTARNGAAFTGEGSTLNDGDENFNDGVLTRWYGIAELKDGSGNGISDASTEVAAIDTLDRVVFDVELTWKYAGTSETITEVYHTVRDNPVVTTP